MLGIPYCRKPSRGLVENFVDLLHYWLPFIFWMRLRVYRATSCRDGQLLLLCGILTIRCGALLRCAERILERLFADVMLFAYGVAQLLGFDRIEITIEHAFDVFLRHFSDVGFSRYR